MGELKALVAILICTNAAIVYSCPDTCRCDVTSMDCAESSLQALPSGIPVNVKNIHVENNFLENVDGRLKIHERLLYVNLSQNALTHFPKSLPGTIKVLDISNNLMSQIDSTAAAGLNSIEELYLDNNLLSNIPSGFFDSLPELRSITLHANPWTCDCSLQHLQNWLRDNPGVAREEPVCSEPPNFAGAELLSIPDWQLCPPMPPNDNPSAVSKAKMRYYRSVYFTRLNLSRASNATNTTVAPTTRPTNAPTVPVQNQQGLLTAGEIVAIVVGIVGLLAVFVAAALILAGGN